MTSPDSSTWAGLSAPPPAGYYVLDPSRSLVRFTARKARFLRVEGEFPRLTGAFTVASDLDRSSVVALVAADGVRTNNRSRDRHLVGPRFFDAQRHPYLRFQSRALTSTPTGWILAGDLTVAGVTRPVELGLQLRSAAQAEGRVRVVGRTELRRSAFGLTALSWLIADPVEVVVRAEAARR